MCTCALWSRQWREKRVVCFGLEVGSWFCCSGCGSVVIKVDTVSVVRWRVHTHGFVYVARENVTGPAHHPVSGSAHQAPLTLPGC